MYCMLRPCMEVSYWLISRVKLKYVCLCGISIMLLDFFGAFTHMFEKTYDKNFEYPYVGDVHEFVNALRHNEKPAVEPINRYDYTYILHNRRKCVDSGFPEFRMIFIVKSAADHFDRRQGIRNSWGFEKRFFDVPTRTIFILGSRPNDEEIQARIKAEASKYGDIVQADFVDSYYNNTIKTMMGFKWLVEYCSNSKFYIFVDDDIYVSVKNVLRFVRNPANYPDYLKEPRKIEVRKREIRLNVSSTLKNVTNVVEDSSSSFHRAKRQVFDIELPDDIRLFAGFVFRSSPHRHKSSKWYVSLGEYPYHLWPPYITAGAYVLSKEALLDMYYTSFYTKHFRFDDIFLGLIAKKADIEPFHCEEFHFHKKDYTKFNYKYVITSHGYEDPIELLRVWNEQKALGNA